MRLLKDTIISTASAGTGAILSALQAIIVARILGPTSYGIVQVYRLCITYASFGDFGLFWAMIKQVSHNRGAGNTNASIEVRNTVFTVSLGFSLILALCISLYLLLSNRFDGLDLVDISVLFFLIIFNALFLFFKHYFVAIDNFIVRSLLLIIFPSANFAFVLLLSTPFQVTGTLLAMLLAYLAGIAYVLWTKAFCVRLHLNSMVTKKLFKIGLPICGNGILVAIWNNLDRLVILYFLPMVYLGHYGIAAMLKMFLENLYRTVFLTVFPKISAKYGETHDIKAIRSFAWTPIVIGAYFSPFFFGSAILFISPVIRYILPEFIPGTQAAQFVIASAYFGCIQVGIMNFIITVNKVHKIYSYRVFIIAMTSILMVVSIKLGYGLNGIAFCVLFSTFVLVILLIQYFFKLYETDLKEKIKHIIDINFPFLIMIIGLWTCNQAFGYPIDNLYDELKKLVMKEFLFVMFNLPLFFIIQKRTRVFNGLKTFVVNRDRCPPNLTKRE